MDKICGNSYSRLASGIVFTCNAPPHPTHPAQHYYVRDLVAETRAREEAKRRGRRSHLVSIPGERT